MNRRNVIKLGLGTTAISLLPKSVFSTHNNELFPNIFTSDSMSTLVKHGIVKTDRKLAWSVMNVANSETFLSRINSILDSHRYRNELKYSSTDRYKIEPAIRIIDLIREFSGDITFNVSLFDTNPSDFRNVSPTEFNSRVGNLYREVMSVQTTRVLMSKAEDKFGPSTMFQNQFVNSFGIENSTINAKNNKIIQVNDLVSGIIYSIFAVENIRSRTKSEINNYFKNSFNFPDSFDSDSYQNGPFTIRKINIRF